MQSYTDFFFLFIFLLRSSLSLPPFLISFFCPLFFLSLSLISIRPLGDLSTGKPWGEGVGGETQLGTAPLSFQAGSGEGWLE